MNGATHEECLKALTAASKISFGFQTFKC